MGDCKPTLKNYENINLGRHKMFNVMCGCPVSIIYRLQSLFSNYGKAVLLFFCYGFVHH